MQNNPPMLPSDFTPAQRERPALVNDDRQFFNGIFTVAFIFYRIAYRNSDDALNSDGSEGIVIGEQLDPTSFIAPTFETFETAQTANIEVLQNFREPDLNVRLGVYTFFDEELVEALLTNDFRDGLEAISLDTDANLTADPYYWDFVVRQPSGATPQWKDVFIAIDYDVDGTGLIKIEPYPQTVPTRQSIGIRERDRCGARW